MNTKLNRQLHAELNARGLMNQKANMVLNITKGRTEHSSQMTDMEGALLLAAIKEHARTNALQKNEKANNMRRKLISMAHQLHWQLPNGKADMKRINKWCIHYGFGKKPLNLYTLKELPKLITIFEQKVFKPAMNKI